MRIMKSKIKMSCLLLILALVAVMGLVLPSVTEAGSGEWTVMKGSEHALV